MARTLLVGLLLVLSFGCKSERKSSSVQEKTPAPPQAEATGGAEDGPKELIPWMHDDYVKAMGIAKARGVPLVIDMWAPWCHTCISMQEYVLRDPTLKKLADRFVWVALDTDKEINAAVQTKLPVNVWPTFYVVSPADESVQARHLGAASLDQFRDFLARGESGHLAAAGKKGDLAPELAAIRDGDRHVIYGRYQEAAAAYGKALEAGGSNWKRRPEVLVNQLVALYRGEKWKECYELGRARLGEVGATRSASAFDFAYFAHRCASKLGPAERSRLDQAITAADGPLVAIVSDAESPLSADDRSDAMRILREVELAEGNEEAALAWAERQRVLLDEAVANAPGAFARMTYIWPRSEVYVYLGEADALVPELKKLMEDLPDQYEPPFRLGWVYLNIGEYDQAVAMAEKAMKMMYGPRRVRAYKLLAEIHKARGDASGERKARMEVLTTYKALKEGHESPAGLEQAQKELDELSGG